MTYGPPAWRPAAFFAGALVSGSGALFVVPLWALAAVLVAAGIRDLLSRPALTLGDEGFSYIAGLRRESADWLQVAAVRVRQERHFLAFGRTVEIDLVDDTLIVLSRVQLGAEPEDVAAGIEAAWQHAVRSASPS